MYVELLRVKKHLNLNEDFTEDDTYLLHLIEVSEAVVERHLDNKLSAFSAGTGKIPKPVEQAILLLVGNFYENRESVTYGAASEVPLAYQYLLSLYKNYGTSNNV